MGRLARVIFWWLAVPLLIVTLLGVISYIRLPQSLPPVGNVANPSLNEVISSLKELFVPLTSLHSTTGTGAQRGPIPILMYHYVRDNVDQTADPLGYGLSVPPAEFERQLQYLHKNGYTAVTMDQVTKGDYGAKSVALTFDDGYKDFIDEAYPLLQRYGFTATIYIITNRLDDPHHLSRDNIVYLANRGIEIGSHSVTHANLAHQTPEALTKELADSQKTLAELINKPVTAVSYPSGKYSAAVVAATRANRYTSAVTVVEGLADPQSDLLRLARIRIRRGVGNAEFSRLLTKSILAAPPISTDRAPGS